MEIENILEELNKKYHLNLTAVNNREEFLIELVKLSHLGIERGKKTSEFYHKSTRLLEYVTRTESSGLTLLLLQSLLKIQKHSKFYLSENTTNLKQLCGLLFIPFSTSKREIYHHTMQLITCCDGKFSIGNIKSTLRSRMSKMDGNIYECFDLALSLELLHAYVILDEKDSVIKLLIDVITDWEFIEENGHVKEESLEKLLLYSFVCKQEDYLKDTISDYDEILKIDRWGIKFYKFIRNSLSKGKLNLEKIERVILNFNKLKHYSSAEKEFISNEIQLQVQEIIVKKDIEKNNSPKNNINEKKIKQVTRLSPYNLPDGVKLDSIKKGISVALVVYQDQQMSKVMTTIDTKVLTNQNEIDFFVTKPMLQKLKKQAEPGYIQVIDNKSAKKKSKEQKDNKGDKFKWPTTDISGNGFETNEGLKDISELRKMGYQITNTTREKRWSILKQAVPKIGLKKIAYTIAGNVKLRKGQKNGKQKFRYAISEWEHDLASLKQTYYQNNFPWPKT